MGQFYPMISSLDDLRPGGTVSGPVMMGIADVALYVAILGRIGMSTISSNHESNYQLFT